MKILTSAIHSLCLGVIIALPIATPKENMNSAKFVFGTFVNRTYTDTVMSILVADFIVSLWLA